MKAFLSHSSNDKGIVDAVAKQLGRQFCLYDKYDFATGEEFEIAIKRCLDQSALFVLFASKNSFKSIWVKFETDEAWHRKLREQISKSLVYIIDDSIEISALPEWLQRALVARNSTPKSIARDIRAKIDELLRSRRHPYFVGRSNDINRLEEILTPTDGSLPPRVFVVSGLPGVGRKALIRHAISNVIGFRKFVEIQIEEGDSLNDICVKTADLIEPYSNQAEFVEIFNEIKRLPKDEALARSMKNLRALAESGELPILSDEGGLLDSEGYFHAPVLDVLRSITPDDTAYLALVSHRRPQLTESIKQVLQLNPLNPADTKRLVQRLFTIYGVEINPTDLADISEFVAGYPPSAYFAAQQAKDYGVGLVVGHKHRLVKFRSGVFLKHIDSLQLHTMQGGVLQLLASYSPIPLPTVMDALGISLEDADEVLTHLIDLSLVIPEGGGLYRIADPIKEAAISTYGFTKHEVSEKVGTSLEQYLGTDIPQHRRLELSRILFRASITGDKPVSMQTIRLSADIVRLTEIYYHEQEYELSMKYGLVAVEERPDSVTARSFLIRALVKLERWDEAELQLKKFVEYAPGRDIHFFRGFMERHHGNFRNAIREYEEAKRLGRRGAAIDRELSQCYFFLGETETANKHLQEALAKHGDNRYVVDLWVQVACELGDSEQAHEALLRLEVLDQRDFYLYRKSRVDWRFGNAPAALEAIKEALTLHRRPAFAFYAQAIICELAANHIDEAKEHLATLDTRFGGVRRDVRTGLRCRMLNVCSRHDEALSLSERIADKDSRYYKTIRFEALRGLLQERSISDKDRIQYDQEYHELLEVLGPNPSFDFWDLD